MDNQHSDNTIDYLDGLIKRIKDALSTAEDGEALVEVARNAHMAEQELAALLAKIEEDEIERYVLD